MKRTGNQTLKQRARYMRSHMTREELHLWCDCLRGLPVTVKRQEIVGNYIIDFYCHSKKLAIEIDGGQHYDAQENYDKVRTAYLESIGIRVVRYTNLDIRNNFDGVCDDICTKLGLK